MLELNKVHCGDCLELMPRIPDNSIDLTVTSPPYDNLRTCYELLLFEKFQLIAQELYRVTKKGGVVVWVVNDATIKGNETGTSFRQALYFKDCGFNLHDTMIWKSDKQPMNDNRYQACFEYMFVLSKGKPKTFSPIMVKCKQAGIKKTSTYSDKNGKRKKKHGKNPIKQTKVKKSIWEIATSQDCLKQLNNSATFPIQLANDHIISWSNECDTVLDCFLGSGTTAVAAANNGRNWIGIEQSAEYCEIARKRIDRETRQERLNLT